MLYPLSYRGLQRNYNSIQEHSAIYCGNELNADMSYFDDTQYDTELAEVSSSFRGNYSRNSGEDVITQDKIT